MTAQESKNEQPKGVRPGKTVTIVVEGTQHEWAGKEISHAEVVTLEVPDYPQHQEITYSVSYKKGPSNKPEAILPKGASVKVKEGMVFYVSETGQS
ncbi:multiubiquitin domain-containing protein [Massilia scottii]|uniref:multiubiquitin domain-containing protein n=1 Tax=Massilia scottii TaxID=3057166 RepID=UPI0027967D93|nr:multiubiquitin domain-containing protein [Massilia sp. CCM 9029]MDQ1835014.1 multiubiquitin domain-containing protein [Massilia sp. CCM 9029]